MHEKSTKIELSILNRRGNKKEKSNQSYYETDIYTDYQNHLYQCLIKGLDAFPKNQVDQMSEYKKAKITENHKICNLVLNKWKQQIINNKTNIIFETLFPNTALSKIFYIKFKNSTDSKFECTLKFKDLGITKDDIIKKLIKCALLPSNFMNIKCKNDHKIKTM